MKNLGLRYLNILRYRYDQKYIPSFLRILDMHCHKYHYKNVYENAIDYGLFKIDRYFKRITYINYRVPR